MPIPKPRSGESQSKFISRCMSFLNDEGTTGDEATAMCYSQWERAKKEEDPVRLQTDNLGRSGSYEQDKVIAGNYPEIDTSEELPESLKPRHLRDDDHLFEQ